jgi:hypothetical protein
VFKLFKKKSKIDLLNEKYEKLQKEAFELSTVNRTESDRKHAEAHAIIIEIETLEKEQGE